MALADAHGGTLSTSSHTTDHTTTVTFANGTVYAETTRTATVADERQYHATMFQRGTRTPVRFAPRVGYYADSDAAVVIELTAVSPDAPSFLANVGLADATLHVTSEGVVTELSVRYEPTVDGEPVEVQTVVSYDFGKVTVQTPGREPP